MVEPNGICVSTAHTRSARRYVLARQIERYTERRMRATKQQIEPYYKALQTQFGGLMVFTGMCDESVRMCVRDNAPFKLHRTQTRTHTVAPDERARERET